MRNNNNQHHYRIEEKIQCSPHEAFTHAGWLLGKSFNINQVNHINQYDEPVCLPAFAS
jgi:hypothetical protein